MAGSLAEEGAREAVDRAKEILDVLDGKPNDDEEDAERAIEVKTTTTIQEK
jgi:hypothetical protein